MVPTFTLLYLGSWAVTSLATFVASRRLARGETTLLISVFLSFLAGMVWPLMLLGVVELSSVAVYSTAKSFRHDRRIPDSWLSGGALKNVVVQLH